MPDSIQEPKRLRIKNGTESGNWDETQLAPVFLAGVFAMITLVFIVNNRLVQYLWCAFFMGTVGYLTFMSKENPNMRRWQVFYAYLFTQRGSYNLAENKIISLENEEKTNAEF